MKTSMPDVSQGCQGDSLKTSQESSEASLGVEPTSLECDARLGVANASQEDDASQELPNCIIEVATSLNVSDASQEPAKSSSVMPGAHAH